MIYRVAKLTALWSFIIGTLLVALYFSVGINYEEIVINLGEIYGVLALAVNLVMFIIVVTKVFTDKPNRKRALQTCILVAINLPIAYGYFILVARDILDKWME